MWWHHRGLHPAVVTDPLAAARELVGSGGRGIMATCVRGTAVGAKALLNADGALIAGVEPPSGLVAAAVEVVDTGVAGVVDVGGDEWFVEPVVGPPRLIILGAIAAADALVPMAVAAGFSVAVVDTRSWLARPERYPPGTEVRCGTPCDALGAIGIDANTAVVSFLHEARLEDDVLEAALRGPAAYVGAMGSGKSTAAKRTRLAKRGLSDEQLLRLRAPIGLSIGARTPREIAVAVLAEIVAVARGAV
jgi:xanthine dehydrogenase accessory factor